MARQLGRLAVITADPSMTMQVVPLRRPRPVLASSFTVLSFTGPGVPGVASRGDGYSAIAFIKRGSEVAALTSAFAMLARAALPPAESGGLDQPSAAGEGTASLCAARSSTPWPRQPASTSRTQ